MMALGKTNHLWSVRELLLYRAPTPASSVMFGEMQ